jgi:MFS transporter, ACS family, glucarate transporter
MVASTTPLSAAGTATRARYITLAFALTLAVIMYIDRVSLAQAAPFIRRDLGLSTKQWGWIASSFAWAYALFEIPGGWLGDRIGPRRVLMRIVIWWSFFTAATGWAFGFASLVATQVLFGVGEAGCFPNLTRVLATWLPTKERERAQARLWLATRWGGALTPLLVATVLRYVSWRPMFGIFGVIGVVWAIGFYRWYRDDPTTHPKINREELALLPPPKTTAVVHGAIPLGRLITNGSIVLLCAQYFCLAYGWWFYVTWLPTYLREARHTSLQLGPTILALITGLPLLLGGIGCLVSAATVPRLVRATGSVKIARRTMAITGMVGASLCIVLFTQVQDPVRAMFVLGMAGFFNDFVMPNAWATCMDIGGRYAGTVSGAMNMLGGIAGASSTLLVGYLLAWTANDWTLTLYISAAIYLVGACCWFFIDPGRTLEAK